MTTTTAPKASRAKRTSVPAPAASAAPSPALDALTSSPHPSGAVMLDVDVLRAHPDNPRRDLGDLTELADSIRSHGVRQNLLVVPDPDEAGAYRLVIGHRRTAAARLAEVTALPAVVDASLTPAEQLELMLLENIQRTDLSPVEEADGYQGLLDLGVDVAAIAKRTGRSAATVRARLKLAALPPAAREKVHTHQATIDDALALADFDGPEDLREILVDRMGGSGFAHQVEMARRDAEARARRVELLAGLEADGVTVLEAEAYSAPKGCTPLRDLGATGTKGYKPLTADEHEDCPGHVAWIVDTYQGPVVNYACQGAKANGHRFLTGTSGTKEQTPEERREIIANNKAAAAAETVRRAWIRDVLLAGKPPSDAVVYAAQVLRPSASPNWPEADLYRDLVYNGKHVAPEDVAADLAKPHLAMRHLLGFAIARVEASIAKDFWRDTYDTRTKVQHLQALASWGYEISDVERTFVEKHGAKGRSS